jgi:hypothetical protein
VIAQGSVLLHLLFVQHAMCEHGELVDVSRGSPALRDAGEKSAARADGPAALADTHAASPGHEHCDALAVRHRPTEVGPTVLAASLLWIEPVSTCGEGAERRAVPILSLAPKCSPPAV